MIDSSPVQNWNGPTDEIRSFRIIRSFRRNSSPVPFEWRPGFLSNGIKRDAKNGVSNSERLSAYVQFLDDFSNGFT